MRFALGCYIRRMRSLGICVALTVALGTGSVAVARDARPAGPSVAQCVAAWNAAPGIAAPHAERRAAVQAQAANTFSVTWSKTSSAALSGPACTVSIVQPSGHVLVIEKRWNATTRTPWRKPIATTGLVRGAQVNAVLGPDGLLTLR